MISDRVNRYNEKRPFSGFLTESKNGFSLYEGLIQRLVSNIVDDNELFHAAKDSFKSFQDDATFDAKWSKIIDSMIRKYRLQLDDRQLHKLFNVVPMEFYNFAKDEGIL